MLGYAVVERLREEGVQVRALVRSTSDTRHLPADVEITTIDTADAQALALVARGCSCVFHAAGHLTISSPFEANGEVDQYRPASIDLTSALLTAALGAGVSRFLYVSSVAVYTPEFRAPITEDSPIGPTSAYGRSKVEAERIVRSFSQAGLNTTVVRPCIAFGPYDRHLLPALEELLDLPLLPLPDGGRHLLDFVYAPDVANLLWLASQQPSAVGQVYNAASGRPLRLRDSMAEFWRQSGRALRTWSVPARWMRHTLPLVRWYLEKRAPHFKTVFTRAGLKYMAQDVSFDISKAQTQLGYRPNVEFADALARTLAARRAPVSPAARKADPRKE